MKLSGQVVLDYASVTDPDVLTNISGAAATATKLWTVSDEKRTLERLKPTSEGFKLDLQIQLDDLINDIPRRNKDSKRELDLEAIAIADERLWLCGSHSNARKKPDAGSPPTTEVEIREARNFLVSFALSGDGALSEPKRLPFSGPNSLRGRLAKDKWLAPFLPLASKEGGLDIEGMAVWGDRVFLGLRGPVIEGCAVVIALRHQNGAIQDGHRLHFLDLKGLAIRDLHVRASDILVLAGPSGAAEGPYRLHPWDPDDPNAKARKPLFTWPYPDDDDDRQEKPEGICATSWKGKRGFLVLYDSPARSRLSHDGIYQADWLVDD